MPVATIKTAIGVAKDTANTKLAANAAASATSLSLLAASVPALSTLTIVDGQLSPSSARCRPAAAPPRSRCRP